MLKFLALAGPVLVIALAQSACAAQPARSWGGNVRAAPNREAPKVATVVEGTRIRIIEKTDTVWNGYPWFRIALPDGTQGYQWGGIICGDGEAIDGAYSICKRDSGQTSNADTTEAGSEKGSKSMTARRHCYLLVDGKVLIDGECAVFPLGNGTYTLNVGGHGKRPSPHFAQVTALADGRFEATWNADPTDRHASDPLGQVEPKDGCWVNSRVRMCAEKIRR